MNVIRLLFYRFDIIVRYFLAIDLYDSKHGNRLTINLLTHHQINTLFKLFAYS